MSVLTSRIILVLAAFLSLGFVLYLLEVVYRFNVLFLRILIGVAFIFVGVYAIYLLIDDLRRRRKAILTA